MRQKSCQVQILQPEKDKQKNSQFAELGGFGIRFCKDLFTQLFFNWDATSLTFGCMTDGDDARKLFFFANGLRALKRYGKSIQAQVDDDLDKIAGDFIKKRHSTNSVAQNALLGYLTKDEAMGVD